MKTILRWCAPLLILAAGCGGSTPSSPSVNLAGNWSGEWQYVTSGVTVTDLVTVTLTQSGSEANGTWTAESGATGQFQHLKAEASTSGTITITIAALGGPPCTATAPITGTASASSLDLTVGSVPVNGTCQWASSQQFALKRQ